jgi:hypothetical protein
MSPWSQYHNAENGLPKDHRLRADGFRPRKFGEPLRAARANHVQIFRIDTIRKI